MWNVGAFTFKSKGNFRKTEKFLKRSLGHDYRFVLEKYGQKGVEALASATPIDTGYTASSWMYEVIQNESSISVVWSNRNVRNGVNIAVILQYGHGTRNGGYVVGKDYINPALKGVFDELADAAWKEVTKI